MGKPIYKVKTEKKVVQIVEQDFTLIEYIGHKIRQFKDAKRWTDTELSLRTRALAPNNERYVSQSTISTIQSGTIKRDGEDIPYNTSLEIIENLAQALEVHISQLFPPLPVVESNGTIYNKPS